LSSGVIHRRAGAIHQLENVGQDFGYRTVKMRWYLLPDFHGLIQCLREGRILNDWYQIFNGTLANARGEVIFAPWRPPWGAVMPA
jgi:cytolysin (calcineurin-like family phosphatase)